MHKISTALLALIVALGLFTPAVHAHTSLENSTPAEGETVEEPLDTIELNFNTVIEEGSTLELSKAEGEAPAPSQVTISDQTMTAVFDDALENGAYTVNWEIIGADGHVIEKQFSFTVDGPASEENTETTGEAAPEEENDTETDTDADQTETDVDSEQEPEEENSLPVFMIVVALLLLVVVIVLAVKLFSSKK
ncbi:copper resistance CopC family protein [Halobacillus kuroshimensis]|uniref:copper resistance CopC family protein n=1 Tax=Halobacillus kuroshimensis TaxID=302481 RepID=UPI00041DB3B5|nr:copper resistance protein CopC [Halobacillus kuroshimensis]